MPKARMISTEIGWNYRVAKLPKGDDAQKFFTWMIGKGDKEGRLPGDAELLSKIVAPYCNYPPELVEDWLQQMESLKDDVTGYGLIERYEVNGHKYIWIPGWENWQPPSYRIKESPSKIPPPPNTNKRKIKQTKTNDKSIANEILDEKLAKKVNYYEQNIGIITPSVVELIQSETENDPDDWFEKAVDEAVFQNKRNIKYIMAILKNWREKGIQSKDKQNNSDPDKFKKAQYGHMIQSEKRPDTPRIPNE